VPREQRRWDQKRRRLALAALAATSLLAGCSAQPTPGESPPDRVLAIAEATDMAMDALGYGRIAWGDGGCMVMRQGGETHLVVFPHGTRLDNEEVVLPDGFRIRSGDDVALGGGWLPADSRERELEALPEECLTESVWWASGAHPG
jgi:hypothetical protein